MTIRATCGDRRSIRRARTERPPIVRKTLSPPPRRRASPPARMAPIVGGTARSAGIFRRLAPMPDALLGNEFETLVEHDPLRARQGDEALAAGPPNEGQAGAARQFNVPAGEARTRY